MFSSPMLKNYLGNFNYLPISRGSGNANGVELIVENNVSAVQQ